jgi:hypothetical protein
MLRTIEASAVRRFQYPHLIASKTLTASDVFGELQWNSKPMLTSNSDQSAVNDARPPTHESSSKAQEESTSVMRKAKQWAIDASGVPHFLCILSKKNYLLFACDKYGCIDLYQLDGSDPTVAPRHLRQFDLFPGNSTNQKQQIIEAFTVYTPFIVVSARRYRLHRHTQPGSVRSRPQRSNRYELGVFLRSPRHAASGHLSTEFPRSPAVG